MKKIIFGFFILITCCFAFACGEKEEEKTPTPDVPVEPTPTPDVPTQPDEPTPDVPVEPTPTPDVPTQPDEPTATPDVPVEPTPTPDEPKDLQTEIYEWLKAKYDNIKITGDIELVETYKDTDITLFCDISDIKCLNYGGKFTAPIVDIEGSITYFVLLDGEEYQYEFPVVFKGYSNVYDATGEWIKKQIGKSVSFDYILPLECNEFGTTIQWVYNGKKLDNGKITTINVDELDREIEFTYVVAKNGNSKPAKMSIYVSSLNDDQKVKQVARELADKYDAGLIDSNITLEKTDELFSTNIKWKSWAEHIVTSKGEYIKPLNTQKIKMQVTIRLNDAQYMTDIVMNVKGIDAPTEWGKIEAFLDMINVKNVKNQSFYLYGCEEGYYQVKTRNYGYLPFYRNEELKVTEDILPDDSPLKANRARTSTNYITIHNTGMAHPTATAKGLNDYIHSTTRVASWHFSVDDTEAYQELKLGEVGWHAGDGSHVYGDYWFSGGVWCIGGGNNNSVGLETCVYSGVDYNMVMRNVGKLVSKLLVTYNLSTSDIRQHYDFSGKDCPQVLRQAGRWAEQLQLIELEYYARTQLKGVQFTWKSLNPEIMDDLGRVSATRPAQAVQVGYEVTVKYNGETKIYTYSSTLNKL